MIRMIKIRKWVYNGVYIAQRNWCLKIIRLWSKYRSKASFVKNSKVRGDGVFYLLYVAQFTKYSEYFFFFKRLL